MPIHDLSYQHWNGTRTARPAVGILARAGLRTLLARRTVRLLLLAAVGFVLVWGALIYVEAQAVKAGPLARLAGAVQVDAQSFRTFLRRQLLVHFLLCLASADLIALDRRHRALQIYLARPVRARDYILGRALAVGALLSLVTWVPAWFLILFKSVLTGGMGWMREFPWLPAAILGYSAILIVPLVFWTLALSSLSRSPRSAGAAVFATIMLGTAAGQALAALTRQEWWLLLSVHSTLEQASATLFGRLGPLDLPAPAAFVALLAAAGLGAWVLARRVRAVDIVGGS